MVPPGRHATAAMGRVKSSTVVTMTRRKVLRGGKEQAARERQAVAGRGGVGHVRMHVQLQRAMAK